MVAGAIVGVFFGAAFATEAGRRGRAEERREKERLVEELQGSLQEQLEQVSLLKTDAESQVAAAAMLEKAKAALEKKVQELEKSLATKGKEATKEKEALVSSLRARVQTIVKEISSGGEIMDKQQLVGLLGRILEEDVFTTDENQIRGVKNLLADPARPLRLQQQQRAILGQVDTNHASFRIPFFSKQEKVSQ
mmetsp:Transcript_1790/g.5057  ORF Transcript_1790/g.5057 Transcript_1790/m.5057 type:complete len:193 (+) Transcript_1790:138-716(+)